MARGRYVRDGRAVSEPGVQELWIAMWLKLFIEFSSNFMTEFRCRGLSNDISSLYRPVWLWKQVGLFYQILWLSSEYPLGLWIAHFTTNPNLRVFMTLSNEHWPGEILPW